MLGQPKGETIRRVNAYDKNGGYTYIPVLIVGAGESGIAMGCRLKDKLGFDQFRIYDRQSGIGGTWWINRYPGVACDIPAIFYSFSFAQNPNWRSFQAPGSEIQEYLNNVCVKYQITDNIYCNTEVDHIRWLEDEGLWEVRLTHLVPGVGDIATHDRQKLEKAEGEQAVVVSKEVVRAKIVCSAVGGLVEPRQWPDNVPGIDKFKGPIFHSARWEHQHDFRDKNVVVIGTGCSAAQLVPRLIEAPYGAKSVTQLMRTPPWVVPRAIPPGGEKGFAEWAPWVFKNVPGTMSALRLVVFGVTEWTFRYFRGGPWAAKQRAIYEEKLKRYIRKTPEKYHSILTPNYGVGCKRRIFDARWYPSLKNPKIDLTTQPLTEVHEQSITIGPGRTYPPMSDTASDAPTDKREVAADIIVMANGFETHKWLHPLTIIGRNGAELDEVMKERGGAQTYQGVALDGYPNLFIIGGPNTATGHSSVILATEGMVNYNLKFIGPILNGDVKVAEVKKEAEIRYTQDLQRALKSTVFQSGGCASWYYSADGWNSTVYPYTQIHFAYRCAFPIWRDWNIEYTRKGLLKSRIRTALRLLTIFGLVAVILRLKSAEMLNVESIMGLTRLAVSSAVGLAIKSLRKIQAAL